MTSVAVNFVGGIPFQLLYDSVELAIHKTRKFKTHLKSLQFTLDSLDPQIIEQIGDNNVQLNLPNNIIAALQAKIEEGKVLVDRLLKLSMWNIRIWGNCYNCIGPNYAEQLGELDRSLRTLMGQLDCEQRRIITELLILGRNTRDKQDELDKKLEKIYDILTAPNNATGRIVWNSVQPVASSSVVGAAPAPALGLVFQQLFDLVVRVKDKGKNMMFKCLLERFESTLYCSQPLIEEISKCNKVLHLPNEQVEYFVEQIQNGVELVHKFSKVHKRANYDKCTYTKGILNLNDSLQRLFIRLKGQVETNVKEAMDSANKIEAVIKKFEGGGWGQNNEFGSEGQSQQLPTIGFGWNVHNRQGPWDVNKETPVNSARITEEGVKPIKASDAVQNQMETQGSCEVPPSPAVGLDVLNMQGPSDVIEETLLDLARVKQEMIKSIEGSHVLKNQIETDSCEVLPLEAETLDSITRNIEVGVMETEGTEVVVSTRDVQETMKGTLEIAVAETEPPSPTVGLDVHGTRDMKGTLDTMRNALTSASSDPNLTMAEESHPWIREALALTSAGGIVNINLGSQGDFIKGVHGNFIKDVDGNIMEVPRFVALKSKYGGRYLRLTENDGSLPAGFLKFEWRKVATEQAKFELVPEKNGKGLVHLRCCYNNKYLVRYTDAFGTDCSSRWIVAAADKPEEDKSNVSCTLFKLEPVNIRGLEFRFVHIQLEKHACLWTCSNPDHRKNFGGLHGGSGALDKDKFNVYTVVAWESLVNKMNKAAMLPRFVALKLMYNRKYLSITENDPRLPAWFLKFNGEEVESPLAKFKVEMANNANGLVHIRCCYNNKYLVTENTPIDSNCCSDKYWIVAAADKPEEDDHKFSCTLFELEPYDESGGLRFRFRHVHLGMYVCMRMRRNSEFHEGLYVGSNEPNKDACDVYTVVDLKG